jgi:hypothetical protein
MCERLVAGELEQSLLMILALAQTLEQEQGQALELEAQELKGVPSGAEHQQREAAQVSSSKIAVLAIAVARGAYG